ncbi:hypothetical protein BDZ97DRAFT_1799125 [Flammula alnicola]|nr:hypothetical protein BDZ97DRAFT_1799125 [Flammula alnicola]
MSVRRTRDIAETDSIGGGDLRGWPASLGVDNIESIIRILSSARYLDINRLCAAALRAYTRRPDKWILVNCPNLETLLIRDIPYHHRQQAQMHLSESLEVILPIKPIQPSIRRLFLDRFNIYLPDVMDLLSWSRLTHLCLSEITIQTGTWFTLIRECTSLEVGQFYLRMDYDQHGAPPPLVTSLPRLRQLHMMWHGHIDHPRIFENLQLASLASLRIDTYLTIPGLYILLQSTPSLKELHLGPNTPWVPTFNRHLRFPGPDGGVEPLSLHAPHLEYLLIQLDKESASTYASVMQWVEKVLKSGWLELGKATNCIKRLELSAENLGSFCWDLETFAGDIRLFNVEGVDIVVRDAGAPMIWGTRSSYEKGLDRCFDNMQFSYIA